MIYRNVEFQGIVVSRKNYRERDMLVEIYTDKYGFKTFLVRGARKRGFKLSAAILPFTFATYVGSINEDGLSFITTTKTLKQFQSINQDIFLNAYATYILELMKYAYQSDDLISLDWFEKTVSSISAINEGLDPQIITNILEVQSLGRFGVQPNWQYCVVCQGVKGPFDYSESYGGLLCVRHFHLDSQRLHLDAKTVFYLRKFSVIDINRISTINVGDKTKENLAKALTTIYDGQVGIYIKAKSFIEKMNTQLY